ncbi:MAG: adenylyltransferase/cytidyltransferase family protein [Oscillochloris sp.]|nr:adenylyltransferase/cytidyltransferase family protein [Oscillochloris sp.]
MAGTALAELLIRREQLRAAGRRLVLTNGVFDLLHVGHVQYLEQARALGDCLFIALNSDESVRRLKGPSRPIVGQEDRATVLAALRWVNAVTIFDQSTAEAVVTELRPDVYVKGADYAGADGTPDLQRLPEARIALSYGADVHLIRYQPGHSTSALIARIISSHQATAE